MYFPTLSKEQLPIQSTTIPEGKMEIEQRAHDVAQPILAYKELFSGYTKTTLPSSERKIDFLVLEGNRLLWSEGASECLPEIKVCNLETNEITTDFTLNTSSITHAALIENTLYTTDRTGIIHEAQLPLDVTESKTINEKEPNLKFLQASDRYLVWGGGPKKGTMTRFIETNLYSKNVEARGWASFKELFPDAPRLMREPCKPMHGTPLPVKMTLQKMTSAESEPNTPPFIYAWKRDSREVILKDVEKNPDALLLKDHFLFVSFEDESPQVGVWNLETFEWKVVVNGFEEPITSLACEEGILFLAGMSTLQSWNINENLSINKSIRKVDKSPLIRSLAFLEGFLYVGTDEGIERFLWNLTPYENVGNKPTKHLQAQKKYLAGVESSNQVFLLDFASQTGRLPPISSFRQPEEEGTPPTKKLRSLKKLD